MVAKQKLVALHRWAALTAGIFLATMGLTGATLVWKDEIEERAHPERFFPDAPAKYDAVLATARSAAPGARTYTIRIPLAGHSFVVDSAFFTTTRHLYTLDEFAGRQGERLVK